MSQSTPNPGGYEIVSITPLKGGLFLYFKPWQIPDDGFFQCEDAYLYRGVLIKRNGFSLLGTLGPTTTGEAVGAMGAASYAHNYVNLTVIPITVSVTDTIVTLNDNGVGGFWQPAFNVLSITAANPGVVTTTSPNGYTTGDIVNFFTTDMVQVNTIAPGYLPFTITVTGAATFTIGDTSMNTPSGAAGVVRKNAGAINYTSGVSTIVFAAATGGAVTTTYRSRSNLPVMGLPMRLITSTNSLEQLIAFDPTKAYLYTAAVAQFNDISGATSWTGGNYDFFWSLNYLGAFWTTNYIDPIRYYISGTLWTDFTPIVNGATIMNTCKMLVSYKNRMVALSTREGGADFMQRARWSQNGTPFIAAPVPATGSFDVTSWRDEIIGKGGFFDAPTSEEIVSCAFYKDTLLVHFERSLWELRYTANEFNPFAWRLISTNFGSESTFSTVPFDDGLLTVSTYGLVRATNGGEARIDQKIPDITFNFANQNPPPISVHGIRDYQRELVYWCYNDTTDSVQSSFPNTVLCYNYVEDTWAIFNQSWTCFGQFTTSNDITWEQMTKAWFNYNQTWNSFNNQSGVPVIVAGTSTGDVMTLDSSTTDNGTNFGFDVFTKAFNPYVTTGRKGNLKYIDFYVGSVIGEFTVSLYSGDDYSLPLKTFTVPTTSTTTQPGWKRVYVNLNENFTVIEMTLTPAQIADPTIGTAPVNILGYQLYYKMGGRFAHG